VVNLVGELALHDRVLVSSFNLLTVDRVRAIEPRIPTAWLTVHEVGEEAVAEVAAHGHVALHPYEAFVDEALMARCRRHGLQVNAWTCDDPARMQVLVDLGIDGICTNVPDIARDVIDGVKRGGGGRA
jgi:glycerophosphoryl diester phosphodiesterase